MSCTWWGLSFRASKMRQAYNWGEHRWAHASGETEGTQWTSSLFPVLDTLGSLGQHHTNEQLHQDLSWACLNSTIQHLVWAGGGRAAAYQKACLEPEPRAPFQSFEKLPEFCSSFLKLAKMKTPPLSRQGERDKEFGKLFCPREESASMTVWY